MARFRAFLTDSESEADETAQNATTATQPPVKPVDAGVAKDNKDPESESDSGKPSHRHRKRTEKASDASTSEEEPEGDSEDDESPPPSQPQMDRSIIPRAQQLGVEPQRMHVMQASLFRAEGGVEGAPTLHKALVQASALSLSRKHSRDSDGDGLRQDSQQVGVCLG